MFRKDIECSYEIKSGFNKFRFFSASDGTVLMEVILGKQGAAETIVLDDKDLSNFILVMNEAKEFLSN